MVNKSRKEADAQRFRKIPVLMNWEQFSTVGAMGDVRIGQAADCKPLVRRGDVSPTCCSSPETRHIRGSKLQHLFQIL
jgi:hypothetical protein